MKTDTDFSISLTHIVEGLFDLKGMAFAACGEDALYRLPRTDPNFDSIDQFQRSLLDLLHVLLINETPSTFALNENPGFLLLCGLASSGTPMELRCAMVRGDEHEPFESLYRHKLLPHCQAMGFDLAEASTVYYMVGHGERDMSMEFFDAVNAVTSGDFLVDEAVALFKACAQDEPEGFAKRAYTGFLWEEALGNRLRVSVWALLPPPPSKAH